MIRHGWMKAPAAAIVLSVLAGAACSEGEEFETRQSALAISGRWAPDPEILEMAQAYEIDVVEAGAWVGTSGCSGSFTEGGAVLRQWIYDNWPQVSHVGGYACRKIAETNSMSVHATGRALDIHIPIDGSFSPAADAADNELGDPLANWLLEHAVELGVQRIIWDRWTWSPSREPRSRAYNGAHPHNDHIHMELTPPASRLETPWFKGPMGPPALSGCDEPLPANGGVIDDADSCFQAFGPAQYWRRVDGQGIGGRLLWTNAFESDSPSNWARWRINLAEAGTYRVEYHSVPEFAVFDSTRYGVKFDAQTEEIYVDQGTAEGEGWQLLGEWDFATGPDQWVAVWDNHPVAVPSDQHILADAIRLSRVLPDGTVMEVPDPDPIQTPDLDPTSVGGGETPDPVAVPDDGPVVINGDGGCCATSGPRDSGWAPIVLVALAAIRRRRRSGAQSGRTGSGM